MGPTRALFLIIAAMLMAAPQVCVGAKNPLVKVGVVLPLSGPQSAFGEMMKNSMLIALKEVKKAGAINGKTIELVFEDDASSIETARSAVEKLVRQDGVVMITGGYLSHVTLAVAAKAQESRVPFLVQTASLDEITERGWNYVFRLTPPVSEYPDTVLSFLKEVAKANTAAILYVDNSFGRSTAEAFAKGAKRARIKVVMEQGYHLKTTDLRSLVAKVKGVNPDVVFMVSYVTDAAQIMRLAKEQHLVPKLFVGSGGGFTMPEFAAQAGDAAENVCSVAPWTSHIPFAGAKPFCQAYKKRYGTHADYHGAQAYAATYVVADALERAKELSPEGFREALVKTDTMTAFGPVRFQNYGKKKQQNKLPTYLIQWQNGAIETVWPRRVSSRSPVYPFPVWPN
ncbi:MAG: ABC transporter substrate-binding protein [Thermodesulfobacteriota bacterium]